MQLGAPRSSQEPARCSQEQPGAARSSQEQPKSQSQSQGQRQREKDRKTGCKDYNSACEILLWVKATTTLLGITERAGGARKSQEQPGAEQPGAARSSQWQPGAPRSSQEPAKCSQEQPGAARSQPGASQEPEPEPGPEAERERQKDRVQRLQLCL